MTKRSFFDGHGMVDAEHRDEPAPRTKQKSKLRLEHERFETATGVTSVCACFYDPDDVTFIRDRQQLRREVYCTTCRENIDLRTGRASWR